MRPALPAAETDAESAKSAAETVLGPPDAAPGKQALAVAHKWRKDVGATVETAAIHGCNGSCGQTVERVTIVPAHVAYSVGRILNFPIWLIHKAHPSPVARLLRRILLQVHRQAPLHRSGWMAKAVLS